MCDTDFAVVTEARIAQQIGALVIATAARRVNSMVALTHGLPDRFAALLDPAARAETIAWLQTHTTPTSIAQPSLALDGSMS